MCEYGLWERFGSESKCMTAVGLGGGRRLYEDMNRDAKRLGKNYEKDLFYEKPEN